MLRRSFLQTVATAVAAMVVPGVAAAAPTPDMSLADKLGLPMEFEQMTDGQLEFWQEFYSGMADRAYARATRLLGDGYRPGGREVSHAINEATRSLEGFTACVRERNRRCWVTA